MITGAQIRAARGLLNWTASVAAERAGTTRHTVQRLERSDGIPPGRVQTLIELKRAFEEAGVEFTGTPEEPGLILRRR